MSMSTSSTTSSTTHLNVLLHDATLVLIICMKVSENNAHIAVSSYLQRSA